MKFNLSRPPQNGGNEEIRSWLFTLYEKLNAVMASIGEDNLSGELKEKIGKIGQSEE